MQMEGLSVKTVYKLASGKLDHRRYLLKGPEPFEELSALLTSTYSLSANSLVLKACNTHTHTRTHARTHSNTHPHTHPHTPRRTHTRPHTPTHTHTHTHAQYRD